MIHASEKDWQFLGSDHDDRIAWHTLETTLDNPYTAYFLTVVKALGGLVALRRLMGNTFENTLCPCMACRDLIATIGYALGISRDFLPYPDASKPLDIRVKSWFE